MAFIASTIPNLVNGVSQQPFALRLASQAEAQENAYSSVVEGLKKRAPTKHVARISDDPLDNAALHVINRDTEERYLVVLSDGALKVFDLDGVEKTVAFPNGTAYLDSTNPARAFRAVTVADYTFIVNTDKTVLMKSDLTANRGPEALINVIQGNYGKGYEVWLDGTRRVDYTTPDGSAANNVINVDTTNIAETLLTGAVAGGGAGVGVNNTGLSGNLNAQAGFTVTRYANTIHVRKTDGSDFTISTEDGFANNAMKAAKGKVQQFSSLPNRAPKGFHVEIVGDRSSSFDNYYVRFDKPSDQDEVGTWNETVAQGIKYRLDPATMPHALVREADGTFTFKQLEWADREVGDEESAPDPSFVGRTITDLFFYRNRLGLLADENVIFSRAGEFFNFWPTTVTTILDSDPIDVAVSHNKVSILRHAVPFAETLLLFSDQTQFVINQGDLLTPTTISINQSTEFETSLDAKPVGAGKHIYFAVKRGLWTGFREYYVDQDTQANDAVDITAHCPKYIPAGVFKITVATNEDVLAVLTTGEPNALYVYKYYWSESEKLQSSWSRWTFGSDAVILQADFIESVLHLVVQRDDGVYLERLSVEAGRTDPGLDYLMRLDRKLTEAQVSVAYDAGTNKTTWTLPYAESGTMRVVVREAGARPVGYVFTAQRPTPTTITTTGDHTAAKVIIGLEYVFRYQFSTLVIKEEAVGGGQASVGEGRLQLRHMSVQYDRTGYFRVEVTPSYRDTYSYPFTGRVIGSGNNVIGTSALETGRFQWPVQGRNLNVTVQIVSESFLPLAIMSAEWAGNFVTHARRL